MDCQTREEIISGGGSVLENTDGTVSVFIPDATGSLVSQPLTIMCCEALVTELNDNGELVPLYTFDIDEQTCRWGAGCTDDIKPFKVVLNPTGNDGTFFDVNTENNESCTLNISFDYLLQLDCEDILNQIQEAANNGGQDAETAAMLRELTASKQIKRHE